MNRSQLIDGIHNLENHISIRREQERKIYNKLMDQVGLAQASDLARDLEAVRSEVSATEQAVESKKQLLKQEEERLKSPECKRAIKRMEELEADTKRKRIEIVESTRLLLREIDGLYASCVEYDKLAKMTGEDRTLRRSKINNYVWYLRNQVDKWIDDLKFFSEKLN